MANDKAGRKRIAVYAGSFDPLTLGHYDVLCRALNLFDEVILAVGIHNAKASLFTIPERLKMLKEVCKGLERVRIESFEGLLVEYSVRMGAVAMIRGLRSEADLTYELPMAMMNRDLAKSIETIFIPTTSAYCFISSSLVKEAAKLGADVRGFVPAIVAEHLADKLKA